MRNHNIKKPIIFETEYSGGTATQLDEKIKQNYTDPTKQKLLIEYPTVYVINNQNKSKKAQYTVYVGETNDIQRRTLQHLDADPKEREDFKEFKNADNVNMYVIGHEHFNKSLTLDIENRLMQYLSSVPAVKHLNNRRHNEQNKYYDSTEFKFIFNDIWKELGKKDPDLFPAQKVLESSALFKASPFNKLTEEQIQAKTKIIEKINQALFKQKNQNQKNGELILVEGNAGSGKTVLMSNIFYDLVHEDQIASKENNKSTKLSIALIVNQKEQLKVYQEISDKLFDKDDNVQVSLPVSFIKNTNPNKKFDIVLIDEAHLLLTQNSQSYSNNKNHPEVKVGDNMLKDILKRAKVTMAVFDPKQVLSTKSIWDGNSLTQLERQAFEKGNLIHLQNQMRIDASIETVKWIRNLIDNGKIDPIPHDDKYEIRIFKSPEAMQKAIKKKNQNQDNGISRMVATFDWDYSGGKAKLPAGQKYWEVREGNWIMPWNYEINRREKYERKHRDHDGIKYSDQSWAEKDYTINEIGSTYTVQGFDLNYVGVELGPSVKYRNGRIVHDPSESSNKDATQKRGSVKSYADELLKNEFNVLLTRGVHGLYIHAVDPELQKALEEAGK